MKYQEKIKEYIKPQVFNSDKDIVFLNRAAMIEMTASEVYEDLATKFKKDVFVDRLNEFKWEHINAANELQIMLDANDFKDIPTDTGVWGDLANLGSKAMSKILDEESMFKAIEFSESKCLDFYKHALKQDLMPETKNFIQEVLMPRQEKHINSLKAMRRMH